MNENKKWGYIYDKKLEMYIPNLPRERKFTSIIFILLVLSIFSALALLFFNIKTYNEIPIFIYSIRAVAIFLILWIFLIIEIHCTEKIDNINKIKIILVNFLNLGKLGIYISNFLS